MNEKLNIIREKCIAANPERRWEDLRNCKRHWADDFSVSCTCSTDAEKKLPVRLADVLLALNDAEFTGVYLVSSAGRLGKFQTRGASQLIVVLDAIWNLRADDLEKQSEETIRFLYELLR